MNNILLTGIFSDTLVFDTTDLVCNDWANSFIAKLSHDGIPSWAVQIGSSSWASGESVKVNMNNEILSTGTFLNDVIISGDTTRLDSIQSSGVYFVNYNVMGVVNWSRLIVGENVSINSECMALSSDGGTYISVEYEGDMTILGGDNSIPVSLTSIESKDIALIKYDRYGEIVWVQQLGQTSSDVRVQSIKSDQNNNLYVGEYFYDTCNFSDGTNVTSLGGSDIYI